ncbi:unnamed protein product, partial [Prorocentrum cordatum]
VASANVQLQFAAYLATLAHVRRAWILMEKPLQSRMDEHPTMQTVMALLGASTILTYMGAFQPRPLIPKACNLITTLPSTVHNMLAKKRPICSSKKSDRDRFHTEIRGW